MHTILDTITAEAARKKNPRGRPDTRWRDNLRGTLFQRHLRDC